MKRFNDLIRPEKSLDNGYVKASEIIDNTDITSPKSSSPSLLSQYKSPHRLISSTTNSTSPTNFKSPTLLKSPIGPNHTLSPISTKSPKSPYHSVVVSSLNDTTDDFTELASSKSETKLSTIASKQSVTQKIQPKSIMPVLPSASDRRKGVLKVNPPKKKPQNQIKPSRSATNVPVTKTVVNLSPSPSPKSLPVVSPTSSKLSTPTLIKIVSPKTSSPNTSISKVASPRVASPRVVSPNAKTPIKMIKTPKTSKTPKNTSLPTIKTPSKDLITKTPLDKSTPKPTKDTRISSATIVPLITPLSSVRSKQAGKSPIKSPVKSPIKYDFTPPEWSRKKAYASISDIINNERDPRINPLRGATERSFRNVPIITPVYPSHNDQTEEVEEVEEEIAIAVHPGDKLVREGVCYTFNGTEWIQNDTKVGTIPKDKNTGLPDYNSLTPEQQMHIRAQFEARFGIIRENWPGYKIPDMEFDMPLSQIHVLYNHFVKHIYIRENAQHYAMWLIIGWKVVELICIKLLDLPCEKFTEFKMNRMGKYNILLLQMGEKYKGIYGQGWPVEVKILVMSLIEMGAFILLRWLANKSGFDMTGSIDFISNTLDSLLGITGIKSTANVTIPDAPIIEEVKNKADSSDKDNITITIPKLPDKDDDMSEMAINHLNKIDLLLGINDQPKKADDNPSGHTIPNTTNNSIRDKARMKAARNKPPFAG